MGWRKSLLFVVWAFVAVAAKAGPVFSSDPVTLPSAAPGDTVDIALKDYLSDAGTGKLAWSFGTKKPPTWLSLDATTGKLTGNPKVADAGLVEFNVSVRDVDDTGDFNNGFKLQVISPPTWSQNPLDFGIQNEGRPWTFPLSDYVSNAAGGPVTFEASGLPAWMTLDATTGVLSGTPERKHVGVYSNLTLTAVGRGGRAAIKAYGQVVRTVRPPTWVSKEVALKDASEDAPFDKNLMEYVLNPEGTALSFEIVSSSLPQWLNIGKASGTLYGTPRKANIGPTMVNVVIRSVIDGKPYDDTATFKVSVLHVNHAPQWLSNPISLPNAATNVKYVQNLANSASDPDAGDKLKFTIISGPSWLTIDGATGVLAGTPGNSNLGAQSWQVSVTDQTGASDTARVDLTVVKSNEPPRWVQKPVILPNAKEDRPYEVDLSQFTKDADGDPLFFSKIDGPGWVTVTQSGILSGKPKGADVGTYTLRIRVSDNLSGSDLGELKLMVESTNHAPYWVLNPIQVSVKEDDNVKVSIAGYAKDDDTNDALVFSAIEGPVWAQLSKDGTFTGQPRAAHVGENVYRVRVADKEGLAADVRVVLNVVHVNHKPYWTTDPLKLTPAKEGIEYFGSVAGGAADPDPKDTLRFEKLSGPGWIKVSNDGTVTGRPARNDVGLNSFQVRVIDQDNEFSIATANVEVEKVNRPPRWRQNPVILADALEGIDYQFSLVPYAADDDGDTLTFEKVAGPAWVKVSVDGVMSGVPARSDLGGYSVVLRVKDKMAQADTNARGLVIKRNQPPVIDSKMPMLLVKERQQLQITLDQPGYVTDPDGDKMTFKLLAAPNWVSLTAAGLLSVNPKFTNIGDHELALSISDSQAVTEGKIKIRVVRDPRPPIWVQDPLQFGAKTNEKFAETLASWVVDPDQRPVTFTKKGGKAWLIVNANGNLDGLPTDADIGKNEFAIEACNDRLCANGRLVITVEPGLIVDYVHVDEPVPGAPASLIWVIDHSTASEKLIRELKQNIPVFYDALKKVNVRHSGILLSTDAHKWDGLPVREDQGKMLMLWNDANPTAGFNRRVDAAYTADNRYSSPVWSLMRFLDRAPSLNEVFDGGYFAKGIPTEAVVLSGQRDHYPWFAKNSSTVKSYAPEDYARTLQKEHLKDRTPFRVSALTPACPSLVDGTGDLTTAGPENVFRVLADQTLGVYYASGCNYAMPQVLEDLARRVAFRAFVHAKARVKLSKKPQDPSTITVNVAGSPVAGNTASSTDKWRYDAATNEIVMQWHLIDNGQIKPGDQLRIHYRVN